MSKKFRLAHAVLLASLTLFSALPVLAIVPPYQEPGQQPQPAQQSGGAFSEMGTQLEAAGGQKGAGYGAPEDPRLIASLIIRTALGFLGIIFLGLIIYGGFLWMTAGGNEENVGKAKKTIYYAVIGMLIIFAAYSITYFAFRIAFKAYIPPSGVIDKAPAQYKGQGGDYAPWW